jgi:hypothetical protein
MRILAPTGALGAGFDTAALDRGVAAGPHVIACDAGSTDSGPAALGSGTPKLSARSPPSPSHATCACSSRPATPSKCR